MALGLCAGCGVLDSSEQTSLVAGGAVTGLDPSGAGQSASDMGRDDPPSGGADGAAGAGGGSAPSLAPAQPARSPAPLMELPQVLAASQCAALDECLSDTALRNLFGQEDCVSRTSEELLATVFDGALAAVEAGRLLYDPAGLEACLGAIEALACDVLSHGLPEECAAVLIGNVAIGADCSGHLECGATAFCQVGVDCMPRCARRRPAGESCEEARQCQEGLVCEDGACTELAPEGAECGGEGGALCELGLECLVPAPGGSGRCTDPGDLTGFGETCEPDLAHCADGLACLEDATGGYACIEPTEEPGASCTLGLPGECAAGEYCDLGGGLFGGTCRALPDAGEPCANLGLCSPGNVCVPSATPPTCQPIMGNGQPCLIDAMCRSNHCVDLVCASPIGCP